MRAKLSIYAFSCVNLNWYFLIWSAAIKPKLSMNSPLRTSKPRWKYNLKNTSWQKIRPSRGNTHLSQLPEIDDCSKIPTGKKISVWFTPTDETGPGRQGHNWSAKQTALDRKANYQPQPRLVYSDAPLMLASLVSDWELSWPICLQAVIQRGVQNKARHPGGGGVTQVPNGYPPTNGRAERKRWTPK